MADYNFDKINRQALTTLMASRPFWIDIAPAGEIVPGMKKNLILHSGPPVTWEKMCGPQKGAVIGALLYENLATTVDDARKMAASGAIEFAPCHHHQAVGPMAGILSFSMPVIVTEDEVSQRRAYNTLNEGIGKVLRMGAYAPEVIHRLRWMETVMAPVLKRAIARVGRLDLKAIMVQALGMGDELHNRSRAASYILFSKIAPYIVETMDSISDTNAVLRFMEENVHTFLGFAMTSAKVSLDGIHGIEGCSIVTAMARNGTEFGIRVSGLGDQWFTAPAPVPEVLLFPGFTQEDVNPDIGDSAILETVGLGGFVIAGAPAIIQFVGGTVQEAIRRTNSMYQITVGENDAFTIPFLDFRGSPTGIDIRKVIESGVTPFIDTGVAHREPGIGQVGAGLVDAPWEVFEKALIAFADRYS